MFVNYFRDVKRGSPMNLAVARFLIGGYVIWKTVWYDWQLVVQTPFTLAGEPYTTLVPPAASLLLPVEKWALIGTMVLFIVGYRPLFSSFLGALLLGHLGAIRFTLDPSGATTSLFIAVWFLVFFGLFHEEQPMTVGSAGDDIESLSAANRFLRSSRESFSMQSLRWSLLSIALVYFGAGFLKVVQGPLTEWATVENLSRTIVMMNAKNEVVSGIGPHLVEYPLIVFLAAIGTILLELGFVLAVLLGISITPFVLGLLLMQAVIGLSMGPFFFDIYPFFLVFFAWDKAIRAMQSDRQLTIVYDEHCLFCARSLLPFKMLDIRGTITFYSQYDAPDRYRGRESVDFESAMYAFDGQQEYRGYFAFRELFDQFGLFSWLVWAMRLDPVAMLGERLYEFIATNRTRYVTCSVE